jgi:hypothetical protein
VVCAPFPSVYGEKGGALFIIAERAGASRFKKQTPFSPFKKSEGEKGVEFSDTVLKLQWGCQLRWRLRCLTTEGKGHENKCCQISGVFGLSPRHVRGAEPAGSATRAGRSEVRFLCARIQGDELH